MDASLYIISAVVSFCASVAGAVCGIGGGVLIKPILDAFGILSVASISFLSGCTVLSMSCYSVVKSQAAGVSLVKKETGTPLALGAAIGGVMGKAVFQYLSGLVTDKDQVGAIQALCLLIITLGTLIYTVKMKEIRTHQVKNPGICVIIGLVLGVFSSFLGIGGGPINLVVLFFFFSMDTKTAAQNSLYIILFSQAASLINTLVTGDMPEFQIGLLIIMAAGGVLGGAAGRRVNRHMDGEMVNRLFMSLMVMIMAICVYNMIRFM